MFLWGMAEACVIELLLVLSLARRKWVEQES
jgi:hypothetical protein